MIDATLRAEILLKGAVIHERLVAEYGFKGSYQRIKMYLQEARPRIAEELGISPSGLAGLHCRFEVLPGARAQVDWGDEGARVPLRRAKVHGTHGEVIGLRAVRDHVALRPLPQTPYAVAQRHLRHVGKDCLVAFYVNLCSVPASKVRPRQPAKSGPRSPTSRCMPPPPITVAKPLLATHPRAVGRGVTTGDGSLPWPRRHDAPGSQAGPRSPRSRSVADLCRSMTR
ncbi:hypothetical protein [Streptomyces lavendulae]|uniref:hypothetical protein n=1 Tax=Streptomyces lavendulae TaxID=1914 RepID=UPI003D7FD196